MCGIVGIIGPNAEHRVDVNLLYGMTRCLEHRGPDSEGAVVFDGMGLGHRRLSIIDLSDAGYQPMSNSARTVWIVFNGEIYNYREIRDELIPHGHSFSSNSDTEVLLHAYEQWGIEGCLKRLNGMYAFAIWDKTKRLLLLARDRLGIKPLYYSHARGELRFSSEIKSFLQDPDFPRDLDMESFSQFLSHGYTGPERTIFKNITQLEPGYCLQFQDGTLKVRKYWDINPDLACRYKNEKEVIDHFLALFQEAVDYNMVSDTPVGHLLSGGIDSNSILSRVSRLIPEQLSVYTIYFKEESFSEITAAKAMAEQFGCRHHMDLITARMLMDDFDDIIYHQDQLSGNTAAVGFHFLFKSVKENGQKVALAGHGPDEMFAGYETYIASRMAKFFGKTPVMSKPIEKLGRLWGALNRKQSFEFIPLDYKIRKFLEGFSFSPELAHSWWRTVFTENEKLDLLEPHTAGGLPPGNTAYVKWFNRSGNQTFLNQCQYADMKMFLAANVLSVTDCASMGQSVEARPPFLDHRLVEFAFSLPDKYKLRGIKNKWLLRNAFRNELPDWLLKLPKRGLNMPLSFWLAGPLANMMQDTLSSDHLKKAGLLNHKVVRRLMDEHLEKRGNHMYKLWTLLTFTRWCDMIWKAPTKNWVAPEGWLERGKR